MCIRDSVALAHDLLVDVFDSANVQTARGLHRHQQVGLLVQFAGDDGPVSYTHLDVYKRQVMLSPKRIVLGGGVMHQEHLFPMVRKRALEILNGYVVHPAILEHIDTYIVPPGLGNNSGAIGSLLLAVRALG